MIFHKTLASFKNAFNGLYTVWREERNFKIEVIIGCVVIALGFLLRFDFFESLFITIAIVMVLTAEVVNTAVEDICNKIEPSFDIDIKKIKDTMAAFVLLAVVGASIIGLTIFYPYLIFFLSLQ